jgi:ABC-type amino acid transport substrate-binding protein
LTLAGCGEKKHEPDAFASMQRNKFVRIATDAVNMPFEYGEGTGVQGFDVEVAEQIAKDLGFEIKWIKMNYAKLFDLLKNGEVELVISSVPIIPEYEKDFAFSQPYFDTALAIARRSNASEIKDLSSLTGKKVGVQASASGEKFMQGQKTATAVELKSFPTLDDALGALNRGEIQAVVGDQYIMTYSIYKSFPHLMTLETKLESQKLGVLVRKNEKELLSKVNETLERMKSSGDLEALRKKWFQNVLEEVEQKRQEKAKEDALKEAPKSVTLNLIKGAGAAFSFDRLDGFNVQLVGDKGQFTSTPIMTNGNRGSCRISQGVPPGDYRLILTVFRTSAPLEIPKVAARNLTFDINVGSTISIVQR